MQKGKKDPHAPVPTSKLAVMSTPPWCWQARVSRGWKDLAQAVLPPSRYGVAGCQSPQEAQKGSDSQLPPCPRGWPAFVCRSGQRSEERAPEIPGLVLKVFHNLTTPTSTGTFPAKSYSYLITLTFLCLLSPLGLHSPMPRRYLSTYFFHKTQLKFCLLQDTTLDFPSKKQAQSLPSFYFDSILINYSLVPLIGHLVSSTMGAQDCLLDHIVHPC